MFDFVKLFFFKRYLKSSNDIKSLISYVDNNFIPEVTASSESFLRFELWDTNSNEYKIWQLEDVSNFTTITKSKEIELDIKLISALSASKSPLNTFKSLEEMVEKNAPEFICNVSSESIAELLNHNQVRPESDYVYYYNYLRRFLIVNAGGSHHFAAAKYVATKLNQAYLIKRKSYTGSLNSQTIHHICSNFEIFTLNNAGFHYLAGLHVNHDRLVDFYTKPFPIMHLNKTVIFLPKKNAYSMLLADELKLHRCNFMNDYLLQLCDQQNSC